MINKDIRIGTIGIPVKNPTMESEFFRNLFGLPISLENISNHPIRFIKTLDAGEKAFEHLALKVGSRSELGRILKRLINLQIPILGAIDHGYAESIYLDDPENNLIEIVSPRKVNEWHDEFGQIKDANSPFDYSGVYYATENELNESEKNISVDVCHIVLKVPDLEKAREFYEKAMGFVMRKEKKGKVLLLTASECHHQIGLVAVDRNPDTNVIITLYYPICESLKKTIENINEAGYSVDETEKGYLATDPFGNSIYLVLGQ